MQDFRANAGWLIKEIRENKPLYRIQINKFLKPCPLFHGTYSYDEYLAQPFKEGFYIVNTDLLKNGGKHWIAVLQTNHTFCYYDPFGLPPRNKLFKRDAFHVVAKTHNLKFIMNNGEPSQSVKETNICGPACIRFVVMMYDKIRRDSSTSHVEKHFRQVSDVMDNDLDNDAELDTQEIIRFFSW